MQSRCLQRRSSEGPTLFDDIVEIIVATGLAEKRRRTASSYNSSA